MPIWEEGEGAPRALNRLRLALISNEEHCAIDAFGRRTCTHEHPEDQPGYQEIYEQVEGWTVQGWSPVPRTRPPPPNEVTVRTIQPLRGFKEDF